MSGLLMRLGNLMTVFMTIFEGISGRLKGAGILTRLPEA
jgi:hypothetical protein